MSKPSARLLENARVECRQAPLARRSLLSTERTAFWAVTVFAVALLVRLIYLFQIETIPLFYHLAGDGRTYDEWAQRLAAGDWLGQDVFYQAPLYPYFLGVLQVVFGHDLWLIRLLQIGLGAFSCALIFCLGEKLFSRPAGIAAGAMLAVYAPAIFYDGLIEKSVLDLVLLCLLLFVLFNVDARTWIQWVGAGALLALLGLSRENALILLPVIALWMWIQSADQTRALRSQRLSLFIAGFLVVLLPVALRNLFVGGEFKLTTSQLGANFFIGNNPAADGTYGSVRKLLGENQLEGPDAKRLAERALGRDLSAGEVSSYWLSRAADYIAADPLQWSRLLVSKWWLVWHSREIEDSDDFYIYQSWSWLLAFLGRFSHFGTLVPLAAFGVLCTLPRWRQLWGLYGMILSLALSVALFYVFGRYRFSLVPLLVLFAGAGLIELARCVRQRAWRGALLGLCVLIVLGSALNWPGPVSGAGAAGYNNLANAYAKQDRVDAAIKSAERALEVDAGFAVAHYNLGNLYMRQGNLAQAQKHFEAALKSLPNYAEAHSNYGQLRAEQGDIEVGLEHFRRAVALNPGLSRAQFNLGVALAKQGNPRAAAGPLEAAVKLEPNSAQATFYLASVYAAENRYPEAEKLFLQTLRIDDTFAPAHERLAQLLAAQGKKDQALHHYQEAVRLMKASAAASGAR
jgi:Tfp pilus assembly protein PilF/4-amino-4-deoxy-L-arabinose transferase-like glycosyltransferase